MLFQSGSGNDVTFTVQGSDGNPATFTATVNKGGLGLAHSIFYGALPTDGSAASLAYQSQLASDIDAAIKIVQTVKFNLSLASSQITGADNLAGTAVNDAQSSYDKVQQQQSDAEAALKKAEDARNKIQLGIIGFAAKTQESQLTALFADPAASQPRTVLDLIGAHAKI